MSFEQRLQEIREGFERPFWVANISEIFERLSYYGAFASLANYLHERLNFPTEQTGTLTGLFGGMVWFLAIFGGTAADWLGFRRALSLAYLIVFGSVIAFTAYNWLLEHYSPTVVATHTYVNPIVAVLLGWWLAHERVSVNVLISAAMVIGAVFLVDRGMARLEVGERRGES